MEEWGETFITTYTVGDKSDICDWQQDGGRYLKRDCVFLKTEDP